MHIEARERGGVCARVLQTPLFGGYEDFTKNVGLFPSSFSFWKSLLEVEAEADCALDLQGNPLLPMLFPLSQKPIPPLASIVPAFPRLHSVLLTLKGWCVWSSYYTSDV